VGPRRCPQFELAGITTESVGSVFVGCRSGEGLIEMASLPGRRLQLKRTVATSPNSQVGVGSVVTGDGAHAARLEVPVALEQNWLGVHRAQRRQNFGRRFSLLSSLTIASTLTLLIGRLNPLWRDCFCAVRRREQAHGWAPDLENSFRVS
jgi:hypothetical protein